jgi:tetratricopeptide (TPR) repeat protein
MSVNDQLARITKSPPLVSSPSLCRFLRYIVEETLAGRAAGIKEQVLGLEVFDRGQDFNPRLDPIVRVQARNLRSRMATYYEGPGQADPIRIELPKGTYVPVFHHVGPVAEAPRGPTAQAAPELAPGPVEVPVAGVAKASVSVMPAPPPRSPVAANRQMWPRFMVAVVILVVILAGITVLWISRTYAARGTGIKTDSLAQDLVIRGRFAMDRQTESSLRDAIASFQQATARAPRFAAAYAGLADAYNLLAQFGYIAPREGMEKAREAARTSLRIDPRLAEGHVALAAVIEAYDWNWAGAEREYRRAIELSPGFSAGHLWYGMFLRDQGRLQEAMLEMRRAAQLAPYSAMACVNLAYGLLAEGNYPAALEQARRAVDLAPELASASVALIRALRASAQTKDADAVLARARGFASGNPHALSLVACELARLGHRQESLKLVEELDALSRQRYVSPFDLGRVSLALCDGDRALNLFEEAFRQRSSGLIFLRGTKAACMRDTPRFLSLLDKMHFRA